MLDPVYEAFLEGAAADAAAISQASDTVRLYPAGAPRLSPGGNPRGYAAALSGVQHLTRGQGGLIAVSQDPILASITFPPDYCRSIDPCLQFRVAAVQTPLVHPNCRGGLVCLGSGFRPGTPLRRLVEQLYRIVSGKMFATDNAFDPAACSYYLSHLSEIRALRSQPLWRRRLASRIEVARVCRGLPEERGKS